MNETLVITRTQELGSTETQAAPRPDASPPPAGPGTLSVAVADTHGVAVRAEMPLQECVGRPVREIVAAALAAQEPTPRNARLAEVLARTATGAAAIIAGDTQISADAVVTVGPDTEAAHYTLDLTVVPIHVGGGGR
jgi:hypothetical protein